MSTYDFSINSKGICMTQEMRKDRESAGTKFATVTTQGEVPVTTQEEVRATTDRTLNTMDEMAYRELQTKNKNLENSLGEAVDKITVLQLRCDRYEIMRLKVLQTLQEMKEIINEKEK